jgi:death-on-curing family protein
MESKGEIIIYKAENGKNKLEVYLEGESVWLTQQQMAILFKKTKQNISHHINQVFHQKEVERKSTVKKYLTVQKEGKRMISREVEHYNLDVIISVGYRVNSLQGTRFRIWASSILKNYLVKGFAANEKRLLQHREQIQEIYRTIEVIRDSIDKKDLSNDETKALFEIISNYTRSFILLNKFDNNSLEAKSLNTNVIYEIQHEEAMAAIQQLKNDLISRNEASPLFGRLKDEQFKGILKSISQTFDKKFLYPSIEERAAHLLYFIIKNHPFTDGNKRIGAFIFIWFLERNKHLLTKTGKQKINDNALVAIALLVAQSNPDHKDIMIKLVVNLVNN